MKDMMEKMMKKKEGKKADKKAAKMSTLKNLSKEMSEMMGEDVKGLKKVTVASDSEEGMRAGLKKAQEILGKKEYDEDDEE